MERLRRALFAELLGEAQTFHYVFHSSVHFELSPLLLARREVVFFGL